MSVTNIDFLSFLSLHPIDKILSTGTVTYTNNGSTSSYIEAKIQNDTIANPHNKLCFARFVWSLDGGSFNSMDTIMRYSYTVTTTPPGVTSPPLKGLKAAVSIGVNATQIIFQTANGDHGNVADTAGVITYTPVSHEFTIKYALFEVD